MKRLTTQTAAERNTGRRALTYAALGALVTYIGVASAVGYAQEQGNPSAAYCVQGRTNAFGEYASGILNAGALVGITFPGAQVETVADRLEHRTPTNHHPSLLISVGLDNSKQQPVEASLGSCGDEFPGLPILEAPNQ